MTRHFTATVYVVYDRKVLLHKHKKHGIWIGVGGHIDEDELPEEAAVREVKEETGLDIVLYWQDDLKKLAKDEISVPRVQALNRPVHIILEDIGEDHQHIDCIYYAKADTDKISLEAGIVEYKWASEIDFKSMDLQENVKLFCKEALNLVN